MNMKVFVFICIHLLCQNEYLLNNLTTDPQEIRPHEIIKEGCERIAR